LGGPRYCSPGRLVAFATRCADAIPDGRQLLPWDYFRIARDPPAIAGKLQMELHISYISYNESSRSLGDFICPINVLIVQMTLAVCSIPIEH